LLAFTAERVARYKVSRSLDNTDQPLCHDVGKINRSLLRAARRRAIRGRSSTPESASDHLHASPAG
jgi:hypothetical protein